MEDRVDGLNALIAFYEEAEESRQDAAALANRCRDYYDGRQTTAAEKEAQDRRKQPTIVINRIRRKIDFLRGLEMQSRTDPKAYPRTPQHQAGAEAITDALRFTVDQTDFDRKRSMAWENMLVEGIGALEIIHGYRGNQVDVVVNYYGYDRVFHDPHSQAHDFSDARYLGAVVWQDADSLATAYPDSRDAITASVSHGSTKGKGFEDRPAWKVWSDAERKRVRVVLMHYLHDGKWCWAKFVHGGILEKGESPYVDEFGETVCPFIMQSAYIDRDNDRYGVVKDMIDPQDEINARRRKLLHQLNTRQTMGLKGVVDVVKLKAELAKPDGHVELDADLVQAAAERGQRAFDILQNTDQTAGQFNLLQEAKNEIDLMGANAGLAGKDGDQQSGRAIMARQQGGLIEIAPLTDGLSDFTRRCYRHMWMRIRQFWREEKWVRVTDDERNIRFVGLNKPVTLREKLQSLPEQQVQQIAMRMALVPNDARLDMRVDVENAVESLHVDIMIEEVPDTVTLEAETFQQIVNIATSLPGAVPPEVLIEMAPGLKRDIKDKLLKHIEAQGQGQGQPDPMQQQMMALELEAKQAATQKTQADAFKSQSLAEKTNVEAQRLALGY